MSFFASGNALRNVISAADFVLPGGVSARAYSDEANGFLSFRHQVVSQRDGEVEFSVEVSNCSSSPLTISRLCPGVIESSRGGELLSPSRATGWTRLYGGLGRGVRDLCDLCWDLFVQDFHAEDYTLLGDRSLDKYVFIGFTSFSRQKTSVELHLEMPGARFSSLSACCAAGQVVLQPGESLRSETLWIREGRSPRELSEAYFDLLEERYVGERSFRDILGWATWDYYQNRITAEELFANVDYWRDHREIPVEYIQLDDGYEEREGDWLLTNEKFPHGLRHVSEYIRSAGFQPGLWLCPFLVSPNSDTYRLHPDWVLKTATGEPLPVHGFRNPVVYALDCTVPGVTDYLHDLAHALTCDYGFAYLKLDGANGQGLTPAARLADPAVGGAEAMRRGLASFRAGMKEGAFLLNCSMHGLSLGIADAMRIGEYVGGRWDSSKIAKNHGERDRFDGCGEVARALAAVMNHLPQHKRVWVNDSDYLVVRQEGCNSELSLEEARSWASAVSLSGSLTMISDPPRLLAPDRLELLRKVLPQTSRRPRCADFFRKNIPSILAVPAENASEKWLVALVINSDLPARPRDYRLDFAELGLEPGQTYRVFDFWREKYLGDYRDGMTVEALPPHACRVLAFRKASDCIQLLGTTSHISMGEADLESAEFRDGAFRIRTKDRHCRGKVFLHVPEARTAPPECRAEGGRVLSAEIPFDGSETVLKFASAESSIPRS